MTIKTFKSETYNMIGWTFIIAVIQKLRLSTTLIDQIMRCISSVKYKIIMNGQPKGNITPEICLRQRYPNEMAQFIFILCMDAFICFFNHVYNQEKKRECVIQRQHLSILPSLLSKYPKDISGSKCKMFAFQITYYKTQ